MQEMQDQYREEEIDEFVCSKYFSGKNVNLERNAKGIGTKCQELPNFTI